MKQEILAVVDSDQLVDIYNSLAGSGTFKMIAHEFRTQHQPANQVYAEAISGSVDLILSSWQNKNEFYNVNVASAMKTSYTHCSYARGFRVSLKLSSPAL